MPDTEVPRLAVPVEVPEVGPESLSLMVKVRVGLPLPATALPPPLLTVKLNTKVRVPLTLASSYMRIVKGCAVIDPEGKVRVIEGLVKLPLVVTSKSNPLVAVPPALTLNVAVVVADGELPMIMLKV